MDKMQGIRRSNPFPSFSTGNKEDGVYEYCLIMIATGKWVAGSKMLSVRQAEKEWGVNRIAIQRAYKKLESHGLIVSKLRSGYFVTNQEDILIVSNYRVELDALLSSFSDEIIRKTGLAPLPAFKYLARLAEVRDREKPMCSFAECTFIQAETLAYEVASKLGITVTPLVVNHIAGNRNRIPHHVRVLFTTHFHYSDLMSFHKTDSLEVVAVPIEVSSNLILELSSSNENFIVLETEEQMALALADDVKTVFRNHSVETLVTDNIHSFLSQISDDEEKYNNTKILLSPRVWGNVDKKWRDHPKVSVVQYQISNKAWELIADVVGMPLGSLG